ncbi:MAG: MFS transporter [Myxococcaceae bacterium]|nr:MFS transporter [Myxococcaceae bacterium]
MVYEGARSLIGPYLSTLGASATLVGAVAGTGELIGYGLRVGSAYLVTRTRRYWAWTLAGYLVTVGTVPLLGATGSLPLTMFLYAGERLGKAVRAPAKDTLLSFASAATGRGKAFGVHQFMDQLGAVCGPLLVAAVLATTVDDYRLAFATLAVPGAAVIALLLWLRRCAPDPTAYEPAGAPGAEAPTLTGPFWRYAVSIAVLSSGVASFPLLALHAQSRHLLSAATVPVLYAVAMLIEGLTGLWLGHRYDRRGPAVLLAAPPLACGAALAFLDAPGLVWLGVALWGAVNGILDSTVKAALSRFVSPSARALGFGWLSLLRGVGLVLSGVGLGAALEHGAPLTIGAIVATNVVALALLTRVVGALPEREAAP